MNTPNTSPTRPALRRIAALLLGAIALAIAPLCSKATDTLSPQALADKAPALPVTTSFAKGDKAGPNGGVYVLTVENTSAKELKVSATVVVSVSSHDRPRTREVPAMVIAPGKAATIDDLVALDKVTLKAEGYAPLEVEVH
jgi:hypothetical protein